ncbi:MAG: TIGR03086 family metal-binding protein [Nocardioidaceae bacterium]
MRTGWDAPPARDALALLERSVAYTRGSLHLVSRDMLRRPTPCRAWDLEALLRHMDDALSAFTDAAEIGYVDVRPVAPADPAADPAAPLVDRLRSRACALVGAWVHNPRENPVVVGDRPLARGLLAAAAATEITVHGWDVARACGADRPIPSGLAAELLEAAPLLVDAADRPHRFAGRVDVPDDAPPGDRLLGFLGRDPS